MNALIIVAEQSTALLANAEGYENCARKSNTDRQNEFAAVMGAVWDDVAKREAERTMRVATVLSEAA